MGLLKKLKDKYKILSIIGMAKNVGKTTALNFLIDEAMDEELVLGVTSTGRDGEALDLVTGKDKPTVYLDYGTIVSVPTKLYDKADAGLEILKRTNYSTPLGDILLCRVVDGGTVQIGGPTNTVDHKKMCIEMIGLGAEIILIDGAIDRKSIAVPEVSDGTILSTGAVISRNMKTVIEETLFLIGLYRLPEITNPAVKSLIKDNKSQGKILMIDKKNQVKESDLRTGLHSGKYLDELIDENTAYIYLPGALTFSVVDGINPKKLIHTTFVIKDPAKIFISPQTWKRLEKRGLHVVTLDQINVAAITINPCCPGGHSFDHNDFLTEIQNAIPDILVVDVKSGGGLQ